MILGGVLTGAGLGALMARRRGGSRADMIHYAGVYALVFGVIAIFLQIVIGRVA